MTIKNVKSGEEQAIDAKYVFIGAGGGALKLLQKTGIPEADNYAGFPVGGSFLMTENPELTKLHQQKVYGQASVGARRCRYRTWMLVTSMVSAWCCSGHSPPSPPSS